MMKRILAIMALAALIGWPAPGEAAAKKKTVRHKAPPVAVQARASYYTYGHRRAHSPNPAWDVYYTDGTYAGSDPDPLVRMLLQKDDARYHGPN